MCDCHVTTTASHPSLPSRIKNFHSLQCDCNSSHIDYQIKVHTSCRHYCPLILPRMETRCNATSPLARVAGCQTGPIVARLLDIQESKEPHQKFLRYIKHLECLHLDETRERKPAGTSTRRIPLLRHWINAFHEKNYLALSYTWQLSYKTGCPTYFPFRTCPTHVSSLLTKWGPLPGLNHWHFCHSTFLAFFLLQCISSTATQRFLRLPFRALCNV